MTRASKWTCWAERPGCTPRGMREGQAAGTTSVITKNSLPHSRVSRTGNGAPGSSAAWRLHFRTDRLRHFPGIRKARFPASREGNPDLDMTRYSFQRATKQPLRRCPEMQKTDSAIG